MIGKNYVGAFLAIGVAASMGFMGGCLSYTNVSGPESPPSFRSPNNYAVVDVTADALDWVLTRHGPNDGSGYVVNLSEGTSQENAMNIFAEIPSGAVWPSSVEQDPDGMFHVARVWIRASEAKVDVVYPFARLDGQTGQRGVTVWLQGGVRSWRVIRGQYWSPGTVEIPAVAVPWVEMTEEVEAEEVDTGEVEAVEVQDEVEEAVEDAAEEAGSYGGSETADYNEVEIDDTGEESEEDS
jgi:hypothetical protein